VSIEVYIGEPIEHASERAGLERVAEILTALRLPAILLANIAMGGRQIDLVVALDHLTLAIELKSLHPYGAVPTEGGKFGWRQANGRTLRISIVKPLRRRTRFVMK
jgi:hypothetical protein